MKTLKSPILPALAIAAFLMLPPMCALLFTGCASTPIVHDAAYVQNKATRISQFVAGLALAKNPKAAAPLAKAVADLRIVTAKDTVSIDDLTTIALTVPQVANSKYGFGIAAGQLFFEDELERLAIKNPALLKAAGIGMADGIEAALKAVPAS